MAKKFFELLLPPKVKPTQTRQPICILQNESTKIRNFSSQIHWFEMKDGINCETNFYIWKINGFCVQWKLESETI